MDFQPYRRFGQPRPREMAQEAADAEPLFQEDAFQEFKPLPPPTGTFPYRLELHDVVEPAEMERIQTAEQLVFHTVGDTGKSTFGGEAQDAVAWHMEQQVKNATEQQRPAFFYHLGDVIYPKGELDRYPEEFYDPYRFYPPPIFAIAGNHDGYTSTTNSKSLDGFVKNFCTATPELPPQPGHATRFTMTQPHVFWTLRAPLLTTIGLYSNVKGSLDAPGDSTQFDWLVHELREAPSDRFLLVAVHHPPYSLDDDHGSQKSIADALDRAFDEASRIPDLVLTAHAHSYQHFIRSLGGREIRYLVVGAGGFAGYTGLYEINEDDVVAPNVTLAAFNDELPGFMRISVTQTTLTGEYFVVPKPPHHRQGEPTQVDRFTINRGH